MSVARLKFVFTRMTRKPHGKSTILQFFLLSGEGVRSAREPTKGHVLSVRFPLNSWHPCENELPQLSLRCR